MDDLETTLRRFAEIGALDAAKQLLVGSVGMFECVVARGVVPRDLKFRNMGVLAGEARWLDAGLMGDEYNQSDFRLISQRFTAMINHARSINPALGDFYSEIVSERGYDTFEGIRRTFEANFATDTPVRVAEVLPLAFELLPFVGVK